jgi:hypothetical protein
MKQIQSQINENQQNLFFSPQFQQLIQQQSNLDPIQNQVNKRIN